MYIYERKLNASGLKLKARLRTNKKKGHQSNPQCRLGELTLGCIGGKATLRVDTLSTHF